MDESVMRKEEIIARDLLSTIGFGRTVDRICIEAQKYLESNPTRIELCVHAAEMLIPPLNNNELYLLSSAYEWAGAKYRKETIKWLGEYVKAGGVSDYISSVVLTKLNGNKYNQRDMHKALAYSSLAKAYAGEYMFDEAIAALKMAIKSEPLCMGPYATIPMYYVKMGDYKRAFSFLRRKRWNLIYFKDNEIRKCINTAYKNTKEKYKKGYVYRPRRNKKEQSR